MRAMVGRLLAALVTVDLMLALTGPAHAAKVTVTNTNDSGAGWLRQAILNANAAPGADTVRFAIPGDGVNTTSPTSELPRITEALTVEGYGQPGSSPNTKGVGGDAVLLVELSGTNAPDASFGSGSMPRAPVIKR